MVLKEPSISSCATAENPECMMRSLTTLKTDSRTQAIDACRQFSFRPTTPDSIGNPATL